MQLELGSQIRRLKAMRLDPPHEDVIKIITDFYTQKIELHQQLIISQVLSLSRKKVSITKNGPSYQRSGAGWSSSMALCSDATPLVFTTLIDMKPDSKGHASHLLITRAEREALLRDIATRFGTKLDREGAEYNRQCRIGLEGIPPQRVQVLRRTVGVAGRYRTITGSAGRR